MKHLVVLIDFPIVWEWVEGHAVDQKGWHSSSLLKRINHESDALAKQSLLSALEGSDVILGDFPFELIHFELEGKQILGSLSLP
jgi:hypothetical protein